MSATTAEAAVQAAFSEEWGRIVATLIRRTGDWDLAEECAQEAFAQALTSWARDGVPAQAGRMADDGRRQPRARPPAAQRPGRGADRADRSTIRSAGPSAETRTTERTSQK